MARMQGKTTSDGSQLFAGIDVSKAHLDLQLSCERRSRRFTNDPAGFAAIDAYLRDPCEKLGDVGCRLALHIGLPPIVLLNGVRGGIARSPRADGSGRAHPWRSCAVCSRVGPSLSAAVWT